MKKIVLAMTFLSPGLALACASSPEEKAMWKILAGIMEAAIFISVVALVTIAVMFALERKKIDRKKMSFWFLIFLILFVVSLVILSFALAQPYARCASGIF